jgi:hypothetical protein
MSIGNAISRFDLWVLDRVFQPLADRLPERLPGFEVGMSLLFGSLMLSAAAMAAMVALVSMDVLDITINGVIWLVCVTFYLNINRSRPMVKSAYVNPLRFQFLGMRPVSIVFLLYAVWQGISAEPPLVLATWFNTLANAAFSCGLYFVSCNVRPPMKKRMASNVLRPSFDR